MTKQILLNVKDLRTSIFYEGHTAKVVDGVDFIVRDGETLGLTGESGSGKSTIALSLLRLITPPGEIIGGEVWFKGHDLLKMDEEDLNKVRGEEISLITQEPIAALDPIMTSGLQSGEVLEEHRDLEKTQIKEKVIEYLGKVSLPDPNRDYSSYAHQLSKGLAQRVMIASALLCAPSLLIADEPTSALDVTIQRQILELLKDLKNVFNLSIMFITHDLGVIAEMSDRVAIIYAGKIVECADVLTIFQNPAHPYTRGLIGCVLRIDKRHKPEPIPGELPTQFYRPNWCAFYPRCKYASPECQQQTPPSIEIEPGHFVRCFRLDHIR
ncbi:MAG: ABC transporter ATP-binding protein [Candidatus Hodarchaeota archaeon]